MAIFKSEYPGDLKQLEEKIRKFISLSEAELKKNIIKWRENIRYFNHKQNPHLDLTTESILSELNLNSNSLFKDKFNTIFIQKNEIKPFIERQLAEYTSVTKSSIVESMHPDYQKAAAVIKARVDFVERDNRLWERVRVPCIKRALINGLKGNKLEFDRFALGGKGKIVSKVVDEFDILLDINSKDEYYEDSEFRGHIVRLSDQKAEAFLRNFEVSDYKRLSLADPHPFRVTKQEKDYKLYFIQFKKPKEYRFDFQDEPTFFSENDFDIYDVIYSDTLGIIYVNKSPYSTFNLFLYVNRRDDTEVYPEGEVADARPLQDLYNIINTVVFDSGRKANRDVILTDQETYDQRLEVVNEALSFGGVIPDNEGKIKRLQSAGISPEMIGLLERTRSYLQDMGYMHEVMSGTTPGGAGLSGKAVSLLQVQNRRILTPKDLSFSYTGVQETKYLYELISRNFLNAHYVPFNTGNKKYLTPIRKLFSVGQYKKFLSSNDLTANEFETNNQVYYLNPITPETEKYPRLFMDNTLIFINPLFADADVMFDVKFDYDANRDKQNVKEMFYQLMNSGIMEPEDALPMMDIPNSDVIIEKLKAKNKYRDLINQLESNPELFQEVMIAMKRYMIMKSGKQQPEQMM